jgi:hypothetical protein
MTQSEQPVEVFGGESFEAGRVQSLLASEGIEASVLGGSRGTWAPHLSVGGGVDAVRVVVRKADAERARQVIAEQGLASL